MFLTKSNRWVRTIFYGNYFYGLCAVALTIEATLQQKYPLNNAWYYVAIFCLTVAFYTRAYITDSSGYPSEERNQWYFHNKKIIRVSQLVLTGLSFVLMVLYAIFNFGKIISISPLQVGLFILFPLTSALYYGVDARFNIRRFGWMKPFIIGFAWAGVVNIYPILFYTLDHQVEFHFTVIGALLFLKNFMFVSVLCILFDIKDYAADSSQRLNTFIVRSGLRKTIFSIVIPLCIAGLGTFVIYGMSRGFHSVKIFLNVVPFVFLILVAYSLQTRRPLLYYLVYVDGLMLLKAICGTIAMIYF